MTYYFFDWKKSLITRDKQGRWRDWRGRWVPNALSYFYGK